MNFSMVLSLLCIIAKAGCFKPSAPLSGWQTQTLDECDKENKTYCFTGLFSDKEIRPTINRFFLANVGISQNFQTIHASDIISQQHSMKNRRKSFLNHSRIKRDIGLVNDTNFSGFGSESPRVDCSSVCCVKEDTTPPFSHIKENDGWQQVASTPEFPQRVSFYTETCLNAKTPCVGIVSTNDSVSANCVQFYRHHAIAVFNKMTGMTFRYVEVPATCKCVLANKGDDVTPSGPSSAALKFPL